MDINESKITIAIASDHAGFSLKEKVKENFKDSNIIFKDFGCFSADSVDYPDFAKPAAMAVSNKECEKGILICGSGTGMTITANKVKGIRAANCWSEDIAKLAVQHNNINILCMGERFIKTELAFKIINIFLTTSFEGGRHQRRVDKIEN